MPISDRPRRGADLRRGLGWGLALVACLALGACAARVTASDRAELRVQGARVTVVAPEGFCVDPVSVDVNRAGGVLLFGDCLVLGGEAPLDEAPVSGVLAARVSTAPLPGTLTELGDFLTAGPGISTLGRSGTPGSVEVLERVERDGVLFLKIRDSGASPVPGASPVFWRGFFEAGDRLIFGTLTSFRRAEVPDGEAQSVLAELAARTRAANAPPPDAALTVTEADVPG